MNFETYREYCLGKPFVSEGFPFDTETLVFKVGGKLFALANVDVFESINLKCSPEKSPELRERFVGVKPGYHMNKKHWNTVSVNLDVPESIIFELIDESYQLVFKSLTKKMQNELTLG